MSATSKKQKAIEISFDHIDDNGNVIANQDAKVGNIEKVLYQKLGDTWYSFCVVNDEVFVAPVPEEVALAKKANRMV